MQKSLFTLGTYFFSLPPAVSKPFSISDIKLIALLISSSRITLGRVLMQNPFAAALLGHSVVAPLGAFNVRVAALPLGLRAVVQSKIAEGWLDALVHRGEYYVVSRELADLAAPGTDIYDPLDGCYVPHEAYVIIDH